MFIGATVTRSLVRRKSAVCLKCPAVEVFIERLGPIILNVPGFRLIYFKAYTGLRVVSVYLDIHQKARFIPALSHFLVAMPYGHSYCHHIQPSQLIRR